jgi:hypothetical protein
LFDNGAFLLFSAPTDISDTTCGVIDIFSGNDTFGAFFSDWVHQRHRYFLYSLE